MRLLLIHQNFPGQFRDIAPELCNRGHELKAIASSHRPNDPRIEVLRYEQAKDNCEGIHPQTKEVDDWIRRAEKVAEQALKLKQRGWAPDVILGHPGWGETLLIRDVYPASPLIIWPELWLKAEHLGQQKEQLNASQILYLRIKNLILDGAMADANVAILPTHYQASTFPERWSHKVAVIHEGVQGKIISQPRLKELTISETTRLDAETPVITFISRNLEPMRGFPTFMRALPTLLANNKDVHIIIVGGDELSYSDGPGDQKTWREVLLSELKGQLDMSRVHLFGRIEHRELQKLYRRSNLHVYLSKAFVLSWSLLEIMASGTPVLAEANPMMEEFIEPGINGALWRGDPKSLGRAMLDLLNTQERLIEWGKAGRKKITEQYAQRDCINQLEEIIKNQAACF